MSSNSQIYLNKIFKLKKDFKCFGSLYFSRGILSLFSRTDMSSKLDLKGIVFNVATNEVMKINFSTLCQSLND